jgi:hypothetical protein
MRRLNRVFSRVIGLLKVKVKFLELSASLRVPLKGM